MDVYTACPMVQTEHFTLRLVREEDAPALFACYHDKAAVARMNGDNCDFGFYADTREQMAETVAYWLKHYGWCSFVRFAIVDRASDTAVGTVEGFGGEVGVLRLDIASRYEQQALLTELLAFARENFRAYFGNQAVVTKAAPGATERRRALAGCGWEHIGDYRGYPHYYRIELA